MRETYSWRESRGSLRRSFVDANGLGSAVYRWVTVKDAVLRSYLMVKYGAELRFRGPDDGAAELEIDHPLLAAAAPARERHDDVTSHAKLTAQTRADSNIPDEAHKSDGRSGAARAPQRPPPCGATRRRLKRWAVSDIPQPRQACSISNRSPDVMWRSPTGCRP